MLAALGLAQFDRWPELNGRRSHLAKLYNKELSGISGIDLPEIPAYDHTHSWHLYIIKVLSKERDVFMAKLADYNIGYGLHFPPAHSLRYVREKAAGKISLLPETDRACGRIISLPLFPDMLDEDVQYVCEAVKEIVNHG